MFKNAKIGTRLIFGFTIMILITAIISISGSISFRMLAGTAESGNKLITYPLAQLVNFSIPYGNVRSAMRDITATTSLEESEKQKKSMETNWAAMMVAFSEYENVVEANRAATADDEYEAIVSIRKALNEYEIILFDKLIPAAMENQNEEAISIRKVELVPPGNIIRDNINFLVETNIIQSNDSLEEIVSLQETITMSSTLLLFLALISGAVLAYFVTRSITVPVKQLISVSNSMAKGEINFNIAYKSKDEIGILTDNFREVALIINSLVTSLHDMSNDIENGYIHKSIDVNAFHGSYKDVAIGVNSMTGNLINETITFLNCIAKFCEGDFNADIKKLPGDKVVMNKSLDDMRSHLKDINFEINNLVAQASKGMLSSRANTENYGGDWAEILHGLNNLMETVSKPINEAKDVLSEVAIGNFDKKMSGTYEGDFAIIKDSINNTVDNVASYIDEIISVLTSISEKNLDKSIDREYLGKFSAVKDAINDIMDILSDIIDEIYSSSEQVSKGATQISESSITLSQGTSVQAASTEQLNATILTINESTAKNAQDAKEVESVSESAKDNALFGNKNMDEMLISMDNIKDSSNSISNIIKVIEDIAFQTNLLALNASIEAARAGSHGTGFAVVAGEVGILANRSQTAAKESNELITESINRINQGVAIANKTAETLHSIVEDITKIAELITNIASSSEDQALSISEIVSEISKIAEIVQESSATSQESSAAAQELSSQATVLQNMVSEFNLKSHKH